MRDLSPDAAAAELTAALASDTACLEWLSIRGYVPVPQAPPLLPGRNELEGAVHLHAPETPRAPRLLLLWRPELGERGFHGTRLRLLQREVNDYRTFLRGNDYESMAPHLCLVGCDAFLVLFPVDGDPFARRMRYTAERLAQTAEGPLLRSFVQFNADSMAQWARSDAPPGGTGVAARLLARRSARLSYDFTPLFVGGQLDEQFVRFMGAQRERLTELVLEEGNRDALLKPMWRTLREVTGADAAGEMPPIKDLVRQGRFRNALVAAVDTVLLRLVLYRYLEAQYGYTELSGDERTIALGSYDELIERTTRIDRAALTALTRQAGPPARQRPVQTGFDFTPRPRTPPPAQVVDPQGFSAGVRTRAEHYQAVAGGDLHQGSVAEAANVLQTFLEAHHGEEFATLLAGTSTEQYSFHYADLDPRAFQQFYQQTIGTDVRVAYDPASGQAVVRVVDYQRNRKEQGAFYTDERMCRWLVRNTVDRLFEEWAEAFPSRDQAALEPDRWLPVVRKQLDALLEWRVLDPTCGGGIFLRAAFESLSQKREVIAGLVARLPERMRAALLEDTRYRMFRIEGGTPRGAASRGQEESRLGEWEWYILLHMLYGIDVDVKAINVASNLLTLSALSYKPHGICFPSFINTSLKHGNALVAPLKPAERGAFCARFGEPLAALILLRRELRDPMLPREEWREKHARAAGIGRNLLQMRILEAWRDLFPGLTDEARIQRVLRAGVFFYEVEFPEVFFEVLEKDGKPVAALKANPGFQVVLGNPPWEEPAAELKHFLPEFDADYRSLSGQASLKREAELLLDPEIARRWESFQLSLHDYKRLLAAGWYQHQRRMVKGKFPPAPLNLCKYAVELAWMLLSDGGYAGMVLEAGLWGEVGAAGLRQMLLDESELVATCGFINRQELFPDIDNRMKFSTTVFRRGGRTTTFPAVFMRERFDDLERFEALAVTFDADEIRHDPRDCYPVGEVRSLEHYKAERALAAHPVLDESGWAVDTLGEELHAGRQRNFFHPDPGPGYFPLIQGTQFNLFGVHQGELPTAWLDPGDEGAGGFLRERQRGRVLGAIADYLEGRDGRITGGRDAAARDWLREKTGSPTLPPEWLKLDWDGYRLAWRDIARNDDRRTLIAGILPPHVGVSDTAPFIRPFQVRVNDEGITWSLQYPLDQLLYLAGALSSFACDSVARSRLSKAHLKSHLFKALPVPAWTSSPAQRRVAALTARLTCLPATAARPWADYRGLAAAVELEPEADGLVDPAARREAEIELNALMAGLYGLGRDGLRFLMDTLFMTPAHRDTHALMRDALLERLE